MTKVQELYEKRDIPGLIKLFVKAGRKSPDEFDEATRALQKIGKPTIVPLAELSNTPLGFHEPEIKQRIMELFGDLGDAEALEPLISTLIRTRQFIPVKAAAAEALGKIKDKRAVEPLIEAIREYGDNPEIKTKAIWALGKIKDKRAVEPLMLEAIKEYADNPEIKTTAIWALGEQRSIEGGLQPLVQLLWNEITDIRSSAADVLTKLDWSPTDESERIWFLVASQKWNDLDKFGKSASEALYEVAKFDDEQIQKAALQTLERIGDTETKLRFEQEMQEKLEKEKKERRFGTIAGVLGTGIIIAILIWLIPKLPELTEAETRNIVRDVALFIFLIGGGGLFFRKFKKK
ncbi:MAG: HEAT repeat domain-containing protein [bacterium]